MLLWISQITIISIILIFLVHYLINFFKSTLTIPKIKDLVNSPTQKYENIYNTIQNNSNSFNKNKNKNTNTNSNTNTNYKLNELLPTNEDPATMKNELKNFLKKQLNGTNNSAPLGTLSDISDYEKY
jgi:cell shape-determining protein MreC